MKSADPRISKMMLSDRNARIARVAITAMTGAALFLFAAEPGRTHGARTSDRIADYFQPFAATNNLSGTVLVMRRGSPLFEASYGFADRTKRIPNRPTTKFHIASLSILFTSTAVLRLIDQGKLSFETRVSQIVPGIPNGDKITILNLLDQNSGLPDSNDDLPNYDDLLKHHQTPESLVEAVRHLPSASEPGGKSKREEHSGQNLLALIIERKSGLPFAQAMKKLVFEPFGMRESGIDDDSPIGGVVANGYQLSGTLGLKPAPTIHWSAKAGNGSAYTTIPDEWRWLSRVLAGPLLSKSTRRAMLDNGFGWDRVDSARLGEPVYVAGGRAPGFSCFFEYLPNEQLAIFDFANVENAANPMIVEEAAAMLRGKPYQSFNTPLVPFDVSGRPTGEFQFGTDFYRPNATLSLVSSASGVTLNWPGGPAAPLLPLGKDEFKDRYYWIDLNVIRNTAGTPVELDYGKFRGLRKIP